jgi:hypothetical protein
MRTVAESLGEGGDRMEKPANHSTRFDGTDNPRHLRALAALLKSPQPRQTLDAIAGCSNAPDLVAELRRRGLDAPCTRIKTLDRDGQPCRPGIYHLSPADRRKVNKWLSSRATGGGSQ